MIDQTKLELHYYGFKLLNITVSLIFLSISILGIFLSGYSIVLGKPQNYQFDLDYLFAIYYLVTIPLTIFSKLNNLIFSTILLLCSLSLYIVCALPSLNSFNWEFSILLIIIYKVFFILQYIKIGILAQIIGCFIPFFFSILLIYKNIRYYFLLKKTS